MTSKKILESLKSATVERQVEDTYNEMLKAEFPGIELTYPYGCDGYFEFEAGEDIPGVALAPNGNVIFLVLD